MPTLQQIYNSAASVADQTGVDPAIITALASTEWGSNYAGQPTSLGIGIASAAGKGSSGGSSATSGEAGQPSGVWTYANGAEASAAFANYVNYQFPIAAQYLGNAQDFFTSMQNTNYDVVWNVKGQPSSGENYAAEVQYWLQKVNQAASANTLYGGGGGSSVNSLSSNMGKTFSAGIQLAGRAGNTRGNSVPVISGIVGAVGAVASGVGSAVSGATGGSSGNPVTDVTTAAANYAAGPIILFAAVVILIIGLIVWGGSALSSKATKVSGMIPKGSGAAESGGGAEAVEVAAA